MKASAMIEVTENYDVDTAEKAAQLFKEVYDRYPDFIEDRILNGVCVDCGKVLFEDQRDAYVLGAEGETRCVTCAQARIDGKPATPPEPPTYKAVDTGTWLV